MYAGYNPPPAYAPASAEPNALLAALANAGVPPAGTSTSDWFMDTGASSHMASGTGNLNQLGPLYSSSSVTVGNGARMPVTHLATSSIPTSSNPLSLNNVLITPSLVKNLISVRSLTRDNNVSVEFDPDGFSIKDLHTRQEKLRCNSRGDLYPLRPPHHHALHASADLWHQRLGHPGRDQLAAALRIFDFACTKSTAHVCTACQLGKHVRLPFSSSESISYFPFQLVHSDVWTSPVPSVSGYKFYLVIIDDYTHYVWSFPLLNKADVVPTFLNFCAYVQTQFRLPIVALQTDNGREFDNFTMRQFLQSHGIAFRLSCPYTSAQNGKAERILRTLNDSVRAMLLHASAPP
jgi:histone deacetylase 1/2